MTDLELKVKALEMTLMYFQKANWSNTVQASNKIYRYLKKDIESETKSIPIDSIKLISVDKNSFVLKDGEDEHHIRITKDNKFLCEGTISHSVTVR